MFLKLMLDKTKQAFCYSYSSIENGTKCINIKYILPSNYQFYIILRNYAIVVEFCKQQFVRHSL